MFNPKKILVPTDFSECEGRCSMMAVKKAISLSEQFGSQIIFLHVIEENLYRKPIFFVDSAKIGDLMNKLKATAIKQLEETIDFYAKDIKDRCKIIIRNGKPYEEILNEEIKSKVDLIVIASRGLGDVKSVFMGSTTDKVIRHSKCSVLVSRKPDTKIKKQLKDL